MRINIIQLRAYYTKPIFVLRTADLVTYGLCPLYFRGLNTKTSDLNYGRPTGLFEIICIHMQNVDIRNS